MTVAGLIDEVKKRGPRVILTLDDRTGRIEVMLFEETWQKHRDLIAKDALVLVEGLLRFDEFSDAWRLSARRVSDLDKVREQQARRVVLRCSEAQVEFPRGAPGGDSQVGPRRCLPGHHRVHRRPRRSGALALGPEWTVRASRELLEQLEGLLGPGAVQVVYAALPAAATFAADGR